MPSEELCGELIAVINTFSFFLWLIPPIINGNVETCKSDF